MLRSLKEFCLAIDNTSQLCCHFARLSLVNGLYKSFRGLRPSNSFEVLTGCALARPTRFWNTPPKSHAACRDCATVQLEVWHDNTRNARNLERMRTFGTLQWMRTLSCNLVYAICSASCITHQSLSLFCFNFLMIHDASLDFWMVCTWPHGFMTSPPWKTRSRHKIFHPKGATTYGYLRTKDIDRSE